MINKLLILLFLLTSCGSSKVVTPVEKTVVDCSAKVFDSFSLPTREGQLNESSRTMFDEFYNSNYELQLFHVRSFSGYTYHEESSIIYLEDGIFYVKDIEGVKKAENIKLDTVLNKLNQARKKSFQILCLTASTGLESNDFYLKRKDEIIFRFNIMGTAIDEVDETFPRLLNEFAFINLFLED